MAWESLLAFDSLVFVLTLIKTYNGRLRHDFTLLRRVNIVSLVLRDGMLSEEPLRFSRNQSELIQFTGAIYYG